MGQKKRSAASRQGASSNGSLPAPPTSLQETTNLPLPIEAEPVSNGSGDACNGDVSALTNGELVVLKGTLELPNSGGPLEASKVVQEEVSSVRSECEKALLALRRGNTTKALKLIRDACSRHESNALVQRVHGHICMRLASMIEDLTTKQRHLKEAIEAAHKAVVLSPRSVEYSQFHAQLLFEAATDSKGYEEVVQECKRALEIEDPIDPAKESLHEEGQHKLPTAEARIALVQQELQNLIQKANIASISNWMKTLGNGGSEEKLRFIHMRKLVDDPMEQRVSQPKRPHEVKKSVKTPEEKRKDIEVRVAAARLLQQKRDCSPPHSDDGDLKPNKGGSRLERRKSGSLSSRKLNQTQNIEERVERLKPFWNGLSSKEREKMLEVPLDALKQQFNSPKMISTLELLTEALDFAQEKKTWRFWMCCSCEERFIDCHEHAEHVMHTHIDSLSSKLRRLLPHEIDQDIADQILSEDCQPFDGPAAIKLLIESCQVGTDEEATSSHSHSTVETGGLHCLGDLSVPSRETGVDELGGLSDRSSGDTCGDSAITEPSLSPDNGERQDETHNTACLCDEKCQRSKKVLQVGRDFKRHELPLAEDEERTKFLQKVFNLFGILIRNKCLASDHMEKIVQYALDELQTFIPDSSIQYEFNHSPIYVRFLPAPQLRRIFGYLRELVNACGLEQLSDNVAPSVPLNEEEDVILDRLFLNGDFTALTLDERLLKGTSSDNSAKQPSSTHEKDPQSDSLTTLKGGEMSPQTDGLLMWIYQKADYELQAASWKQFRESRAQQGRDILQALEKEFLSLQTFCDRKREHLQYEEAVIMAETLCIEELKKRELKVDGSFFGHEAVLRRHQQEILESRSSGLLSPEQKLELDVIRSILREAQTISLSPQFSCDNAIAVTSTRLSDSDDEEEDSWRVPQLDPCIEVAIQRQKERSTSEVNKLDARILRSMDSVQRLELKLGNFSVLDYRSVVLPLVKSFLKTQLEDAAEKDALQKSDAARDAFLAELSRDEKASSERVSDSGRHLRDRSKEKKKNKEQRRSKDGKRLSGAVGTQKAAGNGSAVDFVGEIDEEDEDSMEMLVVEEAQQVLEAELRWQAEVEDEERKLAETLELQRRVEEEAKEKHLAVLKKKEAERQAQGLGENHGTTTSVNSNSHSQLNSGTYCGDYFTAPSSEGDAIPQLSERTMVLDSSLMNNAIHDGICRSTSSTSNGICERLNYLHLNTDLCIEQLPNGSTERDAGNCIHVESQSSNNLAKLTNNHTGSQESETLDSSSSKPKRGGKNRRRKVSRSLQDENSSRVGSENINTGVGEHYEQSKRSSTNNEKVLCSGADNGLKSHDAGLAWKKKQNSVEDGGTLKNIKGSTQSSNKTLRELKDEQDAEDRFQADLEQAMQRSLANVADLPPEHFHPETSRNDILALSESKGSLTEEVGKGLQNKSGQYNCFLNVVIQSLWHLRKFREEILAISSVHHTHMGDPCVVCALRDIFVGLNSPVSDLSKEVVAPTTLRIALSNLFAHKRFFQEFQMNDASEVLAVMFDCLHKAFTVNSVLSDGDSDTSSGVGSWECQDHTPCVAHSLFGLDIAQQMNCTKCGLESRHLKFTAFFHMINASALRTARILYQENSFDELLRLVDMNQFVGCDVEAGGCGQPNYVLHLLRSAPHVFITVLGWQTSRESSEDISATMDALAVEMDVGVVYCGLDKGFKHRLVSVICYYGQHYHCFAFNYEVGRWVMFDDTTVKVIGSYEDVVDTCRRGHLQPQVLFYEALPRYG